MTSSLQKTFKISSGKIIVTAPTVKKEDINLTNDSAFIISDVLCGQWYKRYTSKKDENDGIFVLTHANYKKDELNWKRVGEFEDTVNSPPFGFYDFEYYDPNLSYDDEIQKFGYTCLDGYCTPIIVGRNMDGTVCGISNDDPYVYYCDSCDAGIDIYNKDISYYDCNDCTPSYTLCKACYEIKDSLHNSNHKFTTLFGSLEYCVSCDICKKYIEDTIYNCEMCDNFDFCKKCFESEDKDHDSTHTFNIIQLKQN